MNRTEHLLACLAEECHEVGQRALKAQRFGLLEVQPEQSLSNWQRLQNELADLLAVMEMLENEAGSLYCITRQAIAAKKEKVEHYMAYAESQGALRVMNPHPADRERPRRFRKKPVVIEAIQWTGRNPREIWVFCPAAELHKAPQEHASTQAWMEIHTREGNMIASAGDWIIKGVKGEFYPCKPDIFEATYEAVEP